jgi:hypothetical protein
MVKIYFCYKRQAFLNIFFQVDIVHLFMTNITVHRFCKSDIYVSYRWKPGNGKTVCPHNCVTPLRFCSFCFDHNSEMEGLRDLSDVLNLFGRYWNRSELLQMFSWKSITKIPIPTFAKFNEKVGIGILVIDFQENILIRSDGFQNLQNKFCFNLRCHSTLCDLPFQSYDQSNTSKNVTEWHSEPSVIRGQAEKLIASGDCSRTTFNKRECKYSIICYLIQKQKNTIWWWSFNFLRSNRLIYGYKHGSFLNRVVWNSSQIALIWIWNSIRVRLQLSLLIIPSQPVRYLHVLITPVCGINIFNKHRQLAQSIITCKQHGFVYIWTTNDNRSDQLD